jgi:ribonuclease HI
LTTPSLTDTMIVPIITDEDIEPTWALQGVVAACGADACGANACGADACGAASSAASSAADSSGAEEINQRLIARGLRPIIWSLYEPVAAFSDGGCYHNGKPDCAASFAAVVIGAQFRQTAMFGRVMPYMHRYESGQLCYNECAPVQPSNNRGELLGMIFTFLLLIHGRALGHIKIWSDSNITVKTLNEWLPNRIRAKTAHELKNSDLLMVAWAMLTELRARAASVTIEHTRSHRPKPALGASAEEKVIWKGNDLADKFAAEALASGNHTRGVQTICHAVLDHVMQ